MAVVVCLRGDECKLVSLLSHFSLFLSLSPSVSPFHHCGEASTRRIECHCSVPYRHPRRPHYGSASVCVCSGGERRLNGDAAEQCTSAMHCPAIATTAIYCTGSSFPDPTARSHKLTTTTTTPSLGYQKPENGNQ